MTNTRSVYVDAGQKSGPNKKAALRCISAARAGLLLRRDHQEHLRMAVKECRFSYLRFHGLFQKDLGVYRENAEGRPIYSWLYADEVYDFLLEIGLRPFVVFDFMPEDLASGSQTVYWEQANVTPPASLEKWQALIWETVRHFTNRYGKEEVDKWYFEVWNEPDNPPFFTGSFEDYFQLYRTAAEAVKEICPSYRVGGPAIASNTGWVRDLIHRCCQENIPLDFISAHTYSSTAFLEGGTPEKIPDIPHWSPGPSWTLGNQRYDPRGVVPAVSAVKKIITDSPLPSLELHYTEWGLTWDYWDPLRDSYQAASYLLSRLHEAEALVDSISYCEISDIFEEDGPPTEEFHGGFGLLTLHGIRKPAYFAYRFLAQLGDRRIFCGDPSGIACEQTLSPSGREIQILFWNDAVRQDQENKLYFRQLHPPLEAGDVQVSVSGLSPGNYLLEIYQAGYEKNDAFTAYLRMNRAESLRRDQLELLCRISDGHPAETRFLTVKESQEPLLIFQVPERENDVFLLVLRPY